MDRPIGVFDSGIGGLSVLRELLQIMPMEKFIYYADSAYAPYGLKTVEEVINRSLAVGNFLIKENKVKALVVACNTATSAAIGVLRQEFSIPIIGMEPALKPALHSSQGGLVLVLGTPMTLKEVKFQELMRRYDAGEKIIPLPCPGLVELIEKGMVEGEELQAYFANLFSLLDLSHIDTVVLGCTHYLFVKKTIKSFFPENTVLLDGNMGTVRQVKRLLKQNNLLKPNNGVLPMENPALFTSGTQEDLERLYGFLNNDLDK